MTREFCSNCSENLSSFSEWHSRAMGSGIPNPNIGYTRLPNMPLSCRRRDSRICPRRSDPLQASDKLFGSFPEQLEISWIRIDTYSRARTSGVKWKERLARLCCQNIHSQPGHASHPSRLSPVTRCIRAKSASRCTLWENEPPVCTHGSPSLPGSDGCCPGKGEKEMAADWSGA